MVTAKQFALPSQPPAKKSEAVKTPQTQQQNTVAAEQFALPAQPPAKQSKTLKTLQNQQQNTVLTEQFTLPAEPPAIQSDGGIQPLPASEALSSSSGEEYSLPSEIASLDVPDPECLTVSSNRIEIATVPSNRQETTASPSSSSTPQRGRINHGETAAVRTPTSGLSGNFIWCIALCLYATEISASYRYSCVLCGWWNMEGEEQLAKFPNFRLFLGTNIFTKSSHRAMKFGRFIQLFAHCQNMQPNIQYSKQFSANVGLNGLQKSNEGSKFNLPNHASV